jgi:ketol-acid reductoisomerase
VAAVLYESDVDMSVLHGRRVAILGYGSQGHAHALNLQDSGVNVVVGLRKRSPSWAKAHDAGLKAMTLEAACIWADVIMVLVPDTDQPALYQAVIEPNLEPGNTLLFAHGLCVHYGWIEPPLGVDVGLVAPKGPGHLVRDSFAKGGGVPCLVAVSSASSDVAEGLALAYACAIGAGRAGIIRTTFQEETETDLFGEQTILCGGLVALLQMCFDTLVEAGYQPEAAYFECIHELKLIVDLIYKGGVSNMYFSISDTAKWGSMTTGPSLIGPEVRERLQATLRSIQDGSFAAAWRAESDGGRKCFNKLLDETRHHPSEEVGARLRSLMPWINPDGATLQAVSGGTG